MLSPGLFSLQVLGVYHCRPNTREKCKLQHSHYINSSYFKRGPIPHLEQLFSALSPPLPHIKTPTEAGQSVVCRPRLQIKSTLRYEKVLWEMSFYRGLKRNANTMLCTLMLQKLYPHTAVNKIHKAIQVFPISPVWQLRALPHLKYNTQQAKHFCENGMVASRLYQIPVVGKIST